VFEKLQDFPDNVAAYVCHGHLTKADFAGVDPGARWDQTKFGFDHLFDFERVAFVSDVTWMNRAVQVFAFFIPGQWRAFPTAEASKAREWIAENQQ
jgi:hypothetical protein